MLHSAGAFFSLYLFWLLLSGYFTPFLMIGGRGSALAVVCSPGACTSVDAEGHPLQLGLRAAGLLAAGC